MLSIDEARARVVARVMALPREDVATGLSVGRFLAGDVVAAADAPAFDNSAMDGFAAHAGESDRTLAVIGEARAGAPFTGTLGDGEAIRISTGAAVPPGDRIGVLQQEHTDIDGDSVRFNDELKPGRNIRRAGEDLQAGAVVLQSGQRVGPAELSVAIGAGAGSLLCARRPRVAILNTGDELVRAGGLLRPGQIHDSNGPTLAALADNEGADVISLETVGDDAGATRQAIERALLADVVLISGGVSVGPHDHVKAQLQELGVEQDFWRIALRPGKPTWFGTKGDQLVFGLPGNPVSVYVTFVLFVRPALRALQGADPSAARDTARMGVAVARHQARDECLRVRIADGVATPTGPQGSHVTSSLVGADALAIIERGEGMVAEGELVPVQWL